MANPRKKEAMLFLKADNPEYYSKLIAGETGILAKIFLDLMGRSRVGRKEIVNLLARYITNKQYVRSLASRDKVSAKGNLVKELGKHSMSWKVFMKALRFLMVVKFRIIIICWWSNKPPVKSKLDVEIQPGPVMHDFIDSEGDYDPPTTSDGELAPPSPGIGPNFRGPTATAVTQRVDEYRKQFDGL